MKIFLVSVTDARVHYYYVAADSAAAARNLLECCSNDEERDTLALFVERDAYSTWEAEAKELTAEELAGPVSAVLGYCPKSPTGRHEVDHHSVRPAPVAETGPVRLHAVDVACLHCGRSGSARITEQLVQW